MNASYIELFPKRLYDYMIAFGINQRDLAQKVGVSEASVSNWLKGNKVPRTDKIDKICAIFNCNYSDLISEPTEKEPAETDPLTDELIDKIRNLSHSDKLEILDYIEFQSKRELRASQNPEAD